MSHVSFLYHPFEDPQSTLIQIISLLTFSIAAAAVAIGGKVDFVLHTELL